MGRFCPPSSRQSWMLPVATFRKSLKLISRTGLSGDVRTTLRSCATGSQRMPSAGEPCTGQHNSPKWALPERVEIRPSSQPPPITRTDLPVRCPYSCAVSSRKPSLSSRVPVKVRSFGRLARSNCNEEDGCGEMQRLLSAASLNMSRAVCRAVAACISHVSPLIPRPPNAVRKARRPFQVRSVSDMTSSLQSA